MRSRIVIRLRDCKKSKRFYLNLLKYKAKHTKRSETEMSTEMKQI